jgi:hypothetical protein
MMMRMMMMKICFAASEQDWSHYRHVTTCVDHNFFLFLQKRSCVLEQAAAASRTQSVVPANTASQIPAVSLVTLQFHITTPYKQLSR